MLSLRDYVYLAIVVALVGAFGWYTFHERDVQAAKDKAADQRVADAQLIHNTEVQDRATLLTTQAMDVYRRQLAAAPDRGAPHVWVRQPAASCPRPVPGDAGSGPAAPAAAAVPAAVPQSDIGAADDKLHADADSEIRALQAQIRAYQAAGVVAK